MNAKTRFTQYELQQLLVKALAEFGRASEDIMADQGSINVYESRIKELNRSIKNRQDQLNDLNDAITKFEEQLLSIKNVDKDTLDMLKGVMNND